MRKLGFWSAMVIAALALPLLATAQVEVSIEPAEAAMPAVGEQITVEVVVNDVVGLYGFQLDLKFNKDAVQIVGEEVNEGPFLKSDGTKSSFSIQTGIFNQFGLVAGVTSTRLRGTTLDLDPATGELIEVVIPESLQGVDGTDAIVTVTFEVINDQLENTFTLDKLKLASPEGEIPSVAVAGVLKPAVANQAPVAVIDAPGTANAGETVDFSGANSTDDGSIAGYAWNFGDGGEAEGEAASHVFAAGGTFTVTLTVTDDAGEVDTATVEFVVTAELPAVVTEHAPGSPMLVLEADYPTADDHGHAYIAVWGVGAFEIQSGMYLEYQIAMYSGNPTFQASVDIHFADGATLRDAQDASGNPIVDQNGIGAHPNNDLTDFARDKWYHRKISLEPLVGKSMHHVMIATDSAQTAHPAGKFRVYVDNIQVTTDEGQVFAVYIDENVLPSNSAATNDQPGPGGIVGIENAVLSAAVTDVAVEPAGKLPVTWGNLKKVK